MQADKYGNFKIGECYVTISVSSGKYKEGLDRLLNVMKKYNISEEDVKEIEDSIMFMTEDSAKQIRDKNGELIK